MRPPSTGIVPIGLPAISDHRKKRCQRQIHGGNGLLRTSHTACTSDAIPLDTAIIIPEHPPLLMANSNSSEQPAWQRNPVFEFFASLKLAVVLLAVLIIPAIAGTIYESSFDAKVARAYVYGAPWFNLWLVF